MNKPRKKTKMISLRLDEDIFEACKSKNLNVSYCVNTLLRAYLYIQKCEKSTPIIGSDSYVPDDMVIDIYSKSYVELSLDYYNID